MFHRLLHPVFACWTSQDCSWRVLFSPVKVPGLRPQSSPCLLTYDTTEEYVEECHLACIWFLKKCCFGSNHLKTPRLEMTTWQHTKQWNNRKKEAKLEINFRILRQRSWRFFQPEAGLHSWQGSLVRTTWVAHLANTYTEIWKKLCTRETYGKLDSCTVPCRSWRPEGCIFPEDLPRVCVCATLRGLVTEKPWSSLEVLRVECWVDDYRGMIDWY